MRITTGRKASLSRASTPNTKAYTANTAAKDRVCKEFFDTRPSKKTGAPETLWEQCDEFPFASTKQGGGYTHPQYGKDNFSVQTLLGTQNGLAGVALGVFYARYRVLNGNNFWVAIK
jgi:hypothetical protein